MMNSRDSVADRAQMQQWRRELHAHPETAFEEVRTSQFVADLLAGWGLEVERGIAGTGVVATLHGERGEGGSIGLRADMDALDVTELNTFAHASRQKGKMHACGHDGHTAILLGAAQALAQDPAFRGTVHFIFQPAEENEGGGREMVAQGLFRRFPVDAVYALHNWPDLPAGHAAVHDAAVMAAFDVFTLRLTGKGCHAAMPHLGTDTIVAASALITQLQCLISREIDPSEPAVFSVTQFHAGDTFNVLPEEVVIKGCLRCFDGALQQRLEARLSEHVDALSRLHGLKADIDYQQRYPATINARSEASICREVLSDLLGEQSVRSDCRPSMASEDFSFLLNEKPGAYIWLGNGSRSGVGALHSPHYDFNDDILSLGAEYWVRLVHRRLGD